MKYVHISRTSTEQNNTEYFTLTNTDRPKTNSLSDTMYHPEAPTYVGNFQSNILKHGGNNAMTSDGM